MGDSGAGIGEGLALLSAAAFAGGSVAIAKGAAQKRGDNGALLSVIVTAAGAGLLWLAFGASDAVPWTPERAPAGLGWFAVSGLLTIVLGRGLLFRSVEALGAVRASAVKRLNPFFSVLLAVLVLREAISPGQALGTALIAASFALLLWESQGISSPGPALAEGEGTSVLAYAYGPASALCYAFGYVARKYGLLHIPDPSLGTFVGATAGLLSTMVAGLFWPRQRRIVTGLLKNVTRWQFAAAALVSVGQLSNFAALKYTAISRVAMISSLEIFIAMILSVFVLRIEGKPSPTTLAAAAAATAGALLVALV